MRPRRRAIGAELSERGVDVRVWAPDRKNVSIVVGGQGIALEREANGYFRGDIKEAGAGTRYTFRLDDERETYPDPASRYQPDGPHGPSSIVDPDSFRWTDDPWRGPNIDRLVIYELHAGTFTQEGTWRAAITHLRSLRDIGINAIEVMPVNEFAGEFGWGYDGVDLWAPTRLYGTPDDFRSFVDAAHAAGIAVILDVVYNHLGPDGCYLRKFTNSYFTTRYKNEWGDALNYDGKASEGVREFVIENAAYWIDEYHLDGLRVDATQSIFDASSDHILAAIVRSVRKAGGARRTFVVAENEPQDVGLITRYGFDAMWNDDWHHAAIVAATGKREAYYTDYEGKPQEFVSMAKSGFLYQGQWYSWQKKPRGTPSGSLAPRRLVGYLQNHDQIANSLRGERLDRVTSPGRYRALTALLLLGPQTPMLFQGQEFASSAPFLYFADHDGDLATSVRNGRKEFMSQFPSVARSTEQLAMPDDPATFAACKLDDTERSEHRDAVKLHRDLLSLRRDDDSVDGAVLGSRAFVLRFTKRGDADRLLIVNFGDEMQMDILPEPLLAPPRDHRWDLVWSSEAVNALDDGGLRIPAESAMLVSAVARVPPSNAAAPDR